MTGQPAVAGRDDAVPAREAVPGELLRRWKRAGWLAVALLAGVYLLQVVTPLRVDNDSVVYLKVATSLADSGTSAGGQVPVGYPAVVAGLLEVGLDSAPPLVLLNIVFLVLGFAAVWWIGRDVSPEIRVVAIALSLLSYPIVRINVMPHPDAMGFGLMLVAVAMLSSVTGERTGRNAMLILGATAVTMLTATVRIAALVLIIPLAWCVLRIAVPREATRRAKILIAIAIVVAIGAGVAVAIGLSEDGTFWRYGQEIQALRKRTPFQFVLNRLSIMLRGITELTLNLPTARWPHVRPWLWIPGLVLTAFFAFTRRLAPWTRPVSVFVLAYLLMLTAWPFFTTRLWVPLIPLIVLHATIATFELRHRRTMRRVVTAFAAWLIVTGLAALAYTSRISLAGENFRSRWGINGGMAHPGHEASGHNERAVEVIRRFDADNPAWRGLIY